MRKENPEWKDSAEGLRGMLYHYASHFLLNTRLSEGEGAAGRDALDKSIEVVEALKGKGVSEEVAERIRSLLDKLEAAKSSISRNENLSEDSLNGINIALEEVMELLR